MAEEMIDVCTEKGVPTGQTLPKSEVHARGLWHICTHGAIFNDRAEVLTQFRGPDVKLMRNVWDVLGVAGHISALTDEERTNPANWDIVQQAWRALVREFDEELGFALPPDMLFSSRCHMFGITRTDQTTEDGWPDRTLSVNFGLYLPEIELSRFKLEPGKVLDVRWTHVNDIEQWLTANIGGPYAVRQPDDFHLLQGVVDCARRMLYYN